MATKDEIQKMYVALSLSEQQRLHRMFKNSKEFDKQYRILHKTIFHRPPPTPEEFLDSANGWLTKPYVDSLYDYNKQDFIDIVKNSDKYWCVVFYGATRLGKSFLTRLLILYTIIWIHHLRDPALYFGLAPGSKLALFNLSFDLGKTMEILIDPLYELIDMSERFKFHKFQDDVSKIQEDVGWDYIVYSRAARSGHITLASKLRLMSSNKDPLKIIGSDMIQAYFTELTYWQEDAGADPVQIYRMLSDSIDRMKATTSGGFHPFTWILIDSSANDAENEVEKFILNDLRGQEGVFFSWRSRWEAGVEKFPIWQKTGKTFQVITGDSSNPAQIVYRPEQLIDIPSRLVIDVPIDAKDRFERNLLKSIKDIAGCPTSSESKFIQEAKTVDKLFDNTLLENIEGLLIANAKDNPEQLLWGMIQDKFFTTYEGKKFVFKRAARETRYWGFDFAYSSKGDLLGVCCLHKEWSSELKEVVYIIDFAFAVGSRDDEINLEAARRLITDIKKNCIVTLTSHITRKNKEIIEPTIGVDGFQSAETIQYLKRNGLEAVRQSVDISIDPYLFLLSCMLSETIKSGKNIFLKNNLNSLYRMKDKSNNTKIDHSLGKTENKYFGDWQDSKAGNNAKDVSDAVCQALYIAYKSEKMPTVVYEQENDRLKANKEGRLDPQILTNAFNRLHKIRKQKSPTINTLIKKKLSEGKLNIK